MTTTRSNMVAVGLGASPWTARRWEAAVFYWSHPVCGGTAEIVRPQVARTLTG